MECTCGNCTEAALVADKALITQAANLRGFMLHFTLPIRLNQDMQRIITTLESAIEWPLQSKIDLLEEVTRLLVVVARDCARHTEHVAAQKLN
jgi:hypothetical protein